MNETRRNGGCQCGAIRYALIGEPLFTHACHCTDCQKRGGAFGLTMFVLRDQLVILQGQPAANEAIADSGNRKTAYFCGRCSSVLWGAVNARPATFSLRPGTLDDTTWFAPGAHIWIRSKQPWVLLGDIPAFDTTYDMAEVWPAESLARLKAAS